MRKGGKAYFTANLVSQASALARYVILARLLGEHELGLAAMLILTAQFFDSVSDTGSDRFIVQDEKGDTPVMQGVVQMVLAARGVLIAIALALSAGVLAALYNQPGLHFPLIAIGLAPLIAGFAHLDMRRAQRTQDFRPESLAILVSETVSLVATSVAAYITRDHTAVIYGLTLRALALVIVSHLTAKRPYRWAWGEPEARRFSLFAMPLFLNGLLLFLGGQGDRLVVGSGLGAAALGQYSAVLLLAYYPSTMLARFLTGIHLPQVSASRLSGDTLTEARWRLGSRTAILSAGIVVGFAIAAPIFVPLLYGSNFSQHLQVIALMGVLQALRFLRFWPTTIAIGAGRSLIVMLNNVARMVGLPIAILAHLQFHTLEAVIGGFIVGELVALLAALGLLRREGHIPLRSELRRVGLFLAICAATVAGAWVLQDGKLLEAGICAASGLVILTAIYLSERETFDSTWKMVRGRLLRRA
jgi:O-antigen/teichoic acid export membrane protein